MVPFAEFTPEGWVVIIGAVFGGVGLVIVQVLTLYLSYLDRKRQAEWERARIIREENVAIKVDQVRREAEGSSYKLRQMVEHIETVRADSVIIREGFDKIEKVTNGLTDRLVQATSAASFAAGEKQERDKAESKASHTPPTPPTSQ